MFIDNHYLSTGQSIGLVDSDEEQYVEAVHELQVQSASCASMHPELWPLFLFALEMVTGEEVQLRESADLFVLRLLCEDGRVILAHLN